MEQYSRYGGGKAKIVAETHFRLRSQKPYYVPEVIKAKVNQAVQQLVNNGLVEETVSPSCNTHH